MIKRSELAKCQNESKQAFTALPDAVKRLLKDNRSLAQKFNKDRQWVSNGGASGTYASNGIYRLNPSATVAPETVSFELRANADGDYRAVDPYDKLGGYKTLAHIVAKRGFKNLVYVDAAGREMTATRLDALFGRPVRAVFDASAL